VEEECGPPLRSARLPHRWPNDLPTGLEAQSFLPRLLCVSRLLSIDAAALNLLSGATASPKPTPSIPRVSRAGIRRGVTEQLVSRQRVTLIGCSLHFSAQPRVSCQLSTVQSAKDVEPGFFVVAVAELLHPPKSDHWKAMRPLPASNRVVGGPNLSTTSDTGWPMYPSACPAQYGAQAVRLSANNAMKSRAIS